MRDELNEYVLALVLTAVLVWYTLVVPAPAAAVSSRRRSPDDKGDVRDAIARAGAGLPAPPDEFDWPEYIGAD